MLAHAGLLAVVSALRPHLATLAEPQRHVLQAAVGWAEPEPAGDRFAVAAATLGLLAAAAEAEPLLVVVDDLPWLDRESADALLFAARRLRHDRVTFLLTRRSGAGSGTCRSRTSTASRSPDCRPATPPGCSAGTSPRWSPTG